MSSVQTAISTAANPKPGFSALIRRAYNDGLLVWVLVLVLATQTALTSEFFFTQRNLANLAAQAVPIGLVALAQMIAIVAGSIDLSVSVTTKLGALLTAGIAADSGVRFIPAVVIAVSAGALLGLFSGVLIARLNVDPLIATFITWTFGSGLALAYTRTPIGGIPDYAAEFAYAQIGPIPIIVICFAAVVIGVHVMLTRTRFGRNIYAVGGDREVSRRIGIPVSRTLIAVMTLSGALAALGGVVLALRLGVGEPRTGDGFELNSIVTAVLGGAAIGGGRGKTLGVLGGVAFFALLNNAFNLQDVDGLAQEAIRGVLILIAITIFSRREGQ